MANLVPEGARAAVARKSERIFNVRVYGPALDLVLATGSLPLALSLRVGPDDFWSYKDCLYYSIPLYFACAAFAFIQFRPLRNMWRYSSVTDLVEVVQGAVISIALFVPCLFIVDRLENFPRSVLAIHFLCMIVLMCGARLARRSWYNRNQRNGKTRKKDHRPETCLILVGAGPRATSFIKQLQVEPRGNVQVVGLVDYSQANVGRYILGRPILGRIDQLPQVISRLQGEQRAALKIVITDAQGSNRDHRPALIDMCQQAAKAKLPICDLEGVPPIGSAASSKPFDLKPICLDDLLRRPQVTLDFMAVEHLIGGRRVLITGAGGSIGSELVRQVAKLGPSRLCLLDCCEYNLYAIEGELAERAAGIPRRMSLINIRERARIHRLFSEECPHLVLHAAALKHVPLVEMQPIEGVLTNVLGTQNVADAALEAGVEVVVQISTDKAVYPTSVMGATKRLGELYCQALDIEGPEERDSGEGAVSCSRFLTVRFGNVLGSSGSVVPLFQKQLAQGGPLTVTHPNMKRYMMTISEAAQLVLQAAANGVRCCNKRGLIYVLDMGEPISICDLARQVIRLAGLTPGEDVPIQFVGLRPGEKIVEELFDLVETQVQTPQRGILAAKSAPRALQALRASFAQLQRLCEQGDPERVLSLLVATVPMPTRRHGTVGWRAAKCASRSR